MRFHSLVTSAVLLLAASSSLIAQSPPPTAKPQAEHKWLAQLLGDWESESEAVMGPGQPPFKCKGTMHARMLGGLWVVAEYKLDMAATPMDAVQTIGFDSETKKYTGTWVDSMMNHMWKYEGTVDASGKILTLEAEGPSFTVAGKMAKFRDVYEVKSADHIVATSLMQADDGKWVEFMKGNMHRKK